MKRRLHVGLTLGHSRRTRRSVRAGESEVVKVTVAHRPGQLLEHNSARRYQFFLDKLGEELSG